MIKTVIAPVIALAGLATAQTAQAQQQACVGPADITDAVLYAMPIAFDAARTACTNRLARSGFMATKGNAFIAPFRTGQDKAWSGALRLFKVVAAKKADGEDPGAANIGAIIATMPDGALRPFVYAFLGQTIAEEIKPADCTKIERGLELISPLPRENVGGLIAFVVDIAEKQALPTCTAAQTSAKR